LHNIVNGTCASLEASISISRMKTTDVYYYNTLARRERKDHDAASGSFVLFFIPFSASMGLLEHVLEYIVCAVHCKYIHSAFPPGPFRPLVSHTGCLG